MNPWLLGGACFLAGAAAGSAGTYGTLNYMYSFTPRPSKKVAPAGGVAAASK